MNTNSKVQGNLRLLLKGKNPNSDSKTPSITRISTTQSFRNRFRSSLSFRDPMKPTMNKVPLNKAKSFKIRSQSNKNESKIRKLVPVPKILINGERKTCKRISKTNFCLQSFLDEEYNKADSTSNFTQLKHNVSFHAKTLKGFILFE